MRRIHTVVDTLYKLGRLVVMVPVLINLIPYLADGLSKV